MTYVFRACVISQYAYPTVRYKAWHLLLTLCSSEEHNEAEGHTGCTKGPPGHPLWESLPMKAQKVRYGDFPNDRYRYRHMLKMTALQVVTYVI